MPTMLTPNGWPASPDPEDLGLVDVTVGSKKIPQVRGGDVATVLGYVVNQVNTRVEPLVYGGCYSFRANVNDPGVLSNHASATAVDYNPSAHPNDTPTLSTWTTEQVDEIHAILAEAGGVVRWGGDYDETVDSMHFEINADPVAVASAARSLGGGGGGGGGGGAGGWQPLVEWVFPAGHTSLSNNYPSAAVTAPGVLTVYWAASLETDADDPDIGGMGFWHLFCQEVDLATGVAADPIDLALIDMNRYPLVGGVTPGGDVYLSFGSGGAG